MMSCTLFLWMRVPSIVEKYKSAVLISGLVTFIAAYHYIRIFNSWVDSYHYPGQNAWAGDTPGRPNSKGEAPPPGADRDSVQRRLPLHGLAPHGAAAADRDHSGDDPLPGGVQQAVLAPRRALGPDDPLGVQGVSGALR